MYSTKRRCIRDDLIICYATVLWYRICDTVRFWDFKKYRRRCQIQKCVFDDNSFQIDSSEIAKIDFIIGIGATNRVFGLPNERDNFIFIFQQSSTIERILSSAYVCNYASPGAILMMDARLLFQRLFYDTSSCTPPHSDLVNCDIC